MWRRGGGGRRGMGDATRAPEAGYSDIQDPSSSAYGRDRGGQPGDRSRRGGGRGGGGGAVVWTDEDDERLKKSIKENRVDDWQTLGDWSEVAASVGGGKTAEECFNRWQALSIGNPDYYGNSVAPAHGQSSLHPGLRAPPRGAYLGRPVLPSLPPETAEGKYGDPSQGSSFHPENAHPGYVEGGSAVLGYKQSYPGSFDGRSVGPVIEPEVRPEPTHGLFPWSSIGGVTRHGARADGGGGSGGGDHRHHARHDQAMWFPHQQPGENREGNDRR